MLRSKLNTILRIRAGEGRTVALLVAVMLLPSVGGAIGSPGAESLFFSRFGVEFLPLMYVALGLVTLLTSFLITTLLGRISKKRLYQYLPLSLSALLLAARILVGLDLSWFYPILWLGMYLLWTLQALLGWGLAGMVCTTRQAKRLFPLFGAGGILGTAIGGLVTQPLVRLVGTENLLLAWAISLLTAFGLIRSLTSGLGDPSTPYGATKSRFTQDLQRGYQMVRRSPLLRWTAVGVLLFSVLLFSLVFPFSRAVTAQFPDEDALAGFLGAFQGLTTVVAFLGSLFLANRLYSSIGFMGAVLAVPFLYLMGFSTLAVYAAFPALVAFRFAQLAWRLGVADTAYQAMFNILPPDRREQTRTFMDGVPRQLGIVLIGAILAIGLRTADPRLTYYLGVLAAGLAVFAVWKARRAYAGALVEALRAGHPQIFFSEERPFGGFQRDAAAVAAAVEGISNLDPTVRRVSAEVLGNLPVPEATQALVRALEDPDPGVRAALLRSLAKARASATVLEVLMCIGDEQAEVRLQAVRTLRELVEYPRGLSAQLERLLGDENPGVRAQVAVILLRADPDSEAASVLREMAVSEDPEERRRAFEAFEAWSDPSLYELALSGLSDSLPAVRRAAAAALAQIDGEKGMDALIESLCDEDPSVREAVADSLASLGEAALFPIAHALTDPRLEAGALKTLQRLGTRNASGELREYAHRRRDTAKQYESTLRLLNLHSDDDDRMKLLLSSLEATAKKHARHAILAMGLLSDRNAISLAVEDLDSPDPNQRANALETLESVGDPVIVRPLLTLWEAPSDPSDGAERTAAKERMLLLLRDPDALLRACAAQATDASDPHARAELRLLAQEDEDLIVRETAASMLQGGGEPLETLATLSTMDRILFLRKIRLFSELPLRDLQQVASIATERLISDGEVFVHQGEQGQEMYIIVSGEVRVMVKRKGVEEEEVARRREGEYVGEMSIVTHEPRMASLVADGEVRTLCIDRTRFEGILRERPETSLAIIRELSNRLKEREGLVADESPAESG